MRSSQPVEILRGFFGAFFALPQDVWGGFLAGWPGLPGNDNHATYLARIKFGIGIALKFPPKARPARATAALAASVSASLATRVV